jgi:diacylglycerol kinase family enzyme
LAEKFVSLFYALDIPIDCGIPSSLWPDSMSSPAVAIVNASSGATADDDAAKRLLDILQARQLSWAIWPARGGGELSALAQKAVESDAEIVVAGGGDGTLNAVASRLAGTNKVFGVLPLGTLNHFAKDLNIPLELGAAVDNIVAGAVSRVDVGEVNGRVFLNNSSIGLYPQIVLRRDLQRKHGRPKWIAFLSALFRTMKQYAAFRVYVTADGRRFTRRTPILFVGNNEYQIEGRSLGARRCLDTGRLCLYVLHNTGPWGLFKFAARALIRRAWRVNDFDALQAVGIDVETKRKRLRVALDGEVVDMDTPLRYRIRSGALQIIAPAIKKDGG